VNLLAFAAPRAPHVDLGPTAGIEPMDPALGHASGPAPYRLLLVGGDAVAGRGVLTHDLALSGSLARSIGRLVGHGVDVETVVQPHLDLEAAEAVVAAARLHHYDALILVLEPERSPRDADETQARLRALLIDAASRLPASSVLTVAVAPPMRSGHLSARDFSVCTELIRRSANPVARVIELPVPSPTPGPAELYTVWGDVIASITAGGLHEPAVWEDDRDAVDEDTRSHAVERFAGLEGDWEPLFRRFVAMACAAYGTRSGSISVLDRESSHYVVCHGYTSQSAPRGDTLCNRTLTTYGGLIVGDARIDPRFADLPSVTGGDVTFYAGYRINDPEGMPVAVLCIFDPEPRSVLGQDIALLRDFALAAERRLHALMRERSSERRGVATA
jgi:hypothetical protein